MNGGLRDHCLSPVSDVCQNEDSLKRRGGLTRLLPDWFFPPDPYLALPMPEGQQPGSSIETNEVALCPCFTMEIYALFGVRQWSWKATIYKMWILICLLGEGTGYTKLPSLIFPCDGRCAGRRELAANGGEPVKLIAHMWIRHTPSPGLGEHCLNQPSARSLHPHLEYFHVYVLELHSTAQSRMKPPISCLGHPTIFSSEWPEP